MASAVDEAASILGIPSDADELKSPEQHQASMFAARQQLQAKQKGDSPIFPSQGSSTGVKKIAAIKPQFKPLNKKPSFVTPFAKKDEIIKKSPQKLTSPKKSPAKLDTSGTEEERQLPTVSSRYHCPSLKRSRGRQPDETVPSDEEHSKSKFSKKEFCSPKRNDVDASPISTPGNSPTQKSRSSPLICSAKSQAGNDEADRQKVNDFFSKKFGMAFPTAPKGADRPKPLLKFSKKEDTDSEYSGVRSPGKFKSTFKALDHAKNADDQRGKAEKKGAYKKDSKNHKRATEETAGNKRPDKPVKKVTKSRDTSVRVEKKTKRKIERSPKRQKETVKRKPSTSTSSSECSSGLEDCDSDEFMKKASSLISKSKTNNSDKHPTKDQKQIMPDTDRKRRKVYSSSESSENEFTLSCTNSDNLESIWVQCEKCNKWRYLRETVDPNLVPDDWICSLNPDKKYNNCNFPEEDWNQLDKGYEFVYSSYSLGSLVWCKMQGYPWWPGMVDNDPISKTFYYKHSNSAPPDKYHVTFFGIQATRAWVGKNSIKVYNPDDKNNKMKYDERKSSKGIREAIAMANQAFHLELNDRKKIYGFKEQSRSVDDVPSTSKAKGSGSRGRGRPRKTPGQEKPTKRSKNVKRSSKVVGLEEEEQSYIPASTSSRLSSLHVIENIENEINQVLRDCSPSPTAFFSK